MKLAWDEVRRLIQMNAQHRSGLRMANVPDATVLDHAQAELHELMDSPDDPEELADLLGVLIHYAVKRGWTEQQLEQLMLRKFCDRFSEPAWEKAVRPPDGAALKAVPLKPGPRVHVRHAFTTFTEAAVREAAPKFVGKPVTDGIGGTKIGMVESAEARGLEVHGMLLMNDGTRQNARLL